MKITTISLVAMLIIVIGCNEDEDVKSYETKSTMPLNSDDPSQDPLPDQIQFKHPLLGVTAINGKIPSWDLHDSNTGKRYALREEAEYDINGLEEFRSGVTEYSVYNLSDSEKSFINSEKINDFPYIVNDSNLAPKIGDLLNEYINSLTSDEEKFTVEVWIKESEEFLPTEYKLEYLIAKGSITNESAYRSRYNSLINAEALDISFTLDESSRTAQEAGAIVLSRCETMPCMTLLLNKNQLSQLLTNVSFMRFDLPVLPFPERNTVKNASDSGGFGGPFTSEGIQLKQFWTYGFDGSLGTAESNNIHVGIFEAGEYDVTHYGFYDRRNSPSRINSVQECKARSANVAGNVIITNKCNLLTTIPSFGSPSLITNQTGYNIHATSMAGIILGNILPDPMSNTALDTRVPVSQLEYFSGFGRENRGYLFYYDLDTVTKEYSNRYGTPTTLAQKIAFEKFAAAQLATSASSFYDYFVKSNPKPTAVNISQGNKYSDPNCRGEDIWSRSTNRLFLRGVLPVKSAGNYDPPIMYNNNKCNVTSPGSAIGAFTVGSHDVYGGSQSQGQTTVTGEQFFNGGIGGWSKLGGVSNEDGKGRSIVDITTIGKHYRNYRIDKKYLITNATYGVNTIDPEPSTGTSDSAAIVTAFISSFVDLYKTRFSSFINDPGLLFVALLLMGDRTYDTMPTGVITGENSLSSLKLDSGFSSRWGAGRLKGRMFNRNGMDDPAGWNIGRMCVRNGEKVRIPVPSPQLWHNVLKPKMNAFKAVTFWFDQNHEIGKQINDYDLAFSKANGSYIVKDFKTQDNKSRVYFKSTGSSGLSTVLAGQTIYLDIIGSRVVNNERRCQNNGMMVYYAYIFENSERDDSDGPNFEIEVE